MGKGKERKKYKEYGMEQIHIPTPDLNAKAEYLDLLEGIISLRRYLDNNKDSKGNKGSSKGHRVFVHCKAGRGRAATFALCFLLTKSLSLDEAMRLLKRQRSVVESSVKGYQVVRRFYSSYIREEGRLDAMMKQARIKQA